MNNSQSYKQEHGCLVHFVRLATTLTKDEESARGNHALACNFAKYSPIFKKKFTVRLRTEEGEKKGREGREKKGRKITWLLTIPPHLKYVATIPCYLSLIACFLT